MLNRLIVRTSSSAWAFIASFVVTFATLQGLLRIGQAFPAASGGAEPFDLQNGLTPQQVLDQLPGYTDQARQLYYAFTAIDYVFPFAAGLFMAALGAFCLRRAFPSVYAKLDARNLLPLLMLATLFDWCENVAAITAITAWPGTTLAMATAIVAAKKLKLGFMMVTQGLVVLLALAAVVATIAQRLRKHP